MFDCVYSVLDEPLLVPPLVSDLSQFPDLPPEVVKAFAAQKAALEAAQFEARVERAARQHEQAVVAEKEAFITELKALIEKLEGQVQDYRRTKFGPKSEKLDPARDYPEFCALTW